jgi:hypothetical protein
VDEALEATRRILKDWTRATEIIERPRSLYKKSPPQRELVDLNEIIREMFVLLRGEANQYSIAMRPELSPDLPKITADPVQLQPYLQLASRQARHMPVHANFQHIETKLQPNRSDSSAINCSSHLIN